MVNYEAVETRRYDPASAIHPIHSGAVFRPAGDAPAGGWPLLIVFSVGGFASTNIVTTLTPANGVIYRLIDELGVAVFWCYAPVSRSDTIGSLAATDQDPLDFNPNVGELGAAYPKGNGNIVQHDGVVGVDWPGTKPSSYVGTHPWSDPLWVMPEKAACWAVQHAKANAADLVVGGIDVTKIGITGYSAGSLTAGFPAMMPDMQGYLGDGTLQGLESTEVRAAVLGGTLAWWPVYDGASMTGAHFYNKTASPDYDDVAETLTDVFAGVQNLCSPALIMSDLGQPGLVASKSGTSYLIRVGDAPDPATLAVSDRYDSTGTVNWPVGVETVVHTSFHGYLLKSLWRSHPDFDLVITKPEGVDTGAVAEGGVAADYEAPDTDDADQYEFEWWERVFDLGEVVVDPPTIETAHYCTVAEAAAMFPQWPESTWPVTIDAELELDGIDAEVNMALADRGFPVPFSSDGSAVEDQFASYLKLATRTGTAYRLVRVLFPDVVGAGETPLWVELKDSYGTMLESIRNGSSIPKSLHDTEDDIDPGTVNTKLPNTDVNASAGTYGQHAFTRRRADQF